MQFFGARKTVFKVLNLHFPAVSDLVLSAGFSPQSWTHNIPKEKEFLRKLVKANVITDLTNGI